MDYIWLIVSGVSVLLIVISTMVNGASGGSLQRKFVKLGNLRGRTYAEIASVVGAPNAVSQTGDGGTLKQWITSGYHIALLFDANNVCQGISSETRV